LGTSSATSSSQWRRIFAADLPKLKTRGTGLSQVWTNLLDNAT